MPRVLKRIAIVLAVLLLVVVAGGFYWLRKNDQRPDPDASVAVAHPAYPSEKGPRVVVDAAHNNFHTIDKRYRPFAELLRADGFVVSAGESRFTAESLRDADILVVATALGSPFIMLARAARSPFTDAECDAVRDWVKAGGRLLLIADHAPASLAAQPLATRFGVELGAGRTADTAHMQREMRSPTWLVFDRRTGTLGDHAILRGRDSSEMVNTVLAFTGQSMKAPPEAVALLPVSSQAEDWMADGRDVPAAGRTMALAMAFGAGRVVMVGEAALFTAQVTGAGRYGFQTPKSDDRQFVLNTLRWLGEGARR